MRVTIEEIEDGAEEELILRCHGMDPGLWALIARIQAAGKELLGYRDKEIHRLSMEDVYYFEVVENRAFFYCRDRVLESSLKLYEFENLTAGSSFFRASKSMVLNADKIDFITPSLSGRFEATLLNGEKVIVSRQYVAALKKKLGI